MRPRGGADRLQELGDRTALAHECRCSGGSHGVVLDVGGLSREADHGRPGTRLEHGGGRGGAVDSGEAKVHQDDIRPRLRAGARCGRALRDAPDDLDSRLKAEQELKGRPVDVVVLHEQDPDRLHGLTGTSSGKRTSR